jgi:CRISPR system Cascade subunit CasB
MFTTHPVMPLEQTVDRLAHALASAALGPGDRAALRRMAPPQPPPVAFLKLAYRALPEQWEQRPADWMTLAAGLALMGPDPHRSGRPAGRVLAEQGFSEARLERLLSAEGPNLHAALLKTAWFLGSRSAPADWTDFARLLLAGGGPERDAARLRIARDFYRPPEAHPRRH